MSKDPEHEAIIRYNDEGSAVKHLSTSDWLFGDSEMARRVRALDWSSTPLGPREQWPAPLRTTLNLVLSSKLPMLILWGPKLIALHNDASLEIFDQEHKAVLGRPMPEVWPEQWPKSEARIMAVMARGESFLQNVSFPRRHQARPADAHFTVTDNPIYLENGSVGGVLAIFQETTQAVEHLRELERTQATLLAAVASAPNAMIIADAAGNVVTFNQAFAKFHRFSSEEASRRAPADYMATFDVLFPDGSLVPHAEWAIPRALRGETGVNVERTIRRKDTGESWTASLSFMPTRNAQGEIMGAVLSAREITEQKRTERALRESELRYATIFEKSPYALVLVKAPSGTCCAVNDAFLRLFEYSREEVLGKTAAELRLTDEQSQQEMYAMLVDQGSLHGFECVRYTKNGRKRNVAVSLDWVQIEDVSYVLATTEDLAARVEAAESKRLYLESQALDKLRSRFLANMSHEFRTPLALILGPAELLLASPDTPDEVRRHLHTIWRNARTLLGYINNLLDMAKVEAGQAAVATTPIDATSLVQTAAPPLAEPLPMHSSEAEGATPEASSMAPVVLVIEDNIEMNRFIVESLNDRYRVESAHDGHEGLEKALRCLPEVILCDLMMPIKSGEEFIREARCSGPLESTPILVLSAKSDDALRIQLLREGVQDYLVKPFGVEELRARVDNWVKRRLCEKAAHEAEEKYRGIIAVCADAIVVINEKQDIVEWNQGAEKIFGYSRDEILGRPVNTVVPPQHRRAHQAHIHKFAEEGRETRILDHSRTFGLRKTGEEFPMAATIARVRIGEQLLMTAVVRDISEEKRREEELSVLASIGAILASLHDEHALDDVVATLARTIADSAAAYLFDCEKSDQLRLTSSSNCNPAVRVYESKARQTYFVPGPTHPIWTILKTRRGLIIEPTPELYASLEPAPAYRDGLRAANARSILAVPVQVGDRCHGVLRIWSSSRIYEPRDLALMEEIGRRCALFIENARLHRAEQLAIRTRDEILGVVAHDLRNPLGVILLEVARMAKSKDADEQMLQTTSRIDRSARRMHRIINDLLDIVGLDGGKMSLELAVLPVAQLISEAVDAQAPLFLRAMLEYRMEVADGLPLICVDRHRMLQVFDNLVGNAIKFSKAGQTITIGAKRKDDEVLVWVRDQGVGIEPENWTRIFDRFWHGDTRNGAGTGLGLAIVKGIVELHGGRVWVESRVGDGSTFYFTIPVAV